METCGLYKCLDVKYSKYDNKIYRLVDIFDTENNIVEIDSESIISLLKTDVIAIMNIYINDEHEIEINQNSVDRIESILKNARALDRLIEIKKNQLVNTAKYYLINLGKEYLLYVPDSISTDTVARSVALSKHLSSKDRLKVIGGAGLKSCNRLFSYLNIDKMDLSEFGGSLMSSTRYMFMHSSIKEIKFGSKIKFSNIDDTEEMFFEANIDKLDLSETDLQLANCYSMFDMLKSNEIVMPSEMDYNFSKNNLFYNFYRCNATIKIGDKLIKLDAGIRTIQE